MFADGGRSVVQVSEDRGVFAGATNATDSAIAKARFLLTRERTTEDGGGS
jgi:hypothetical protein